MQSNQTAANAPLYSLPGFAPWDLPTIAVWAESLIVTCELLDTVHLFLANLRNIPCALAQCSFVLRTKLRAFRSLAV